MTPARLRAASMLCAVSALLSTAACSLPNQDRGIDALPNRSQLSLATRRIVQLQYGLHATYGICTEPGCPAPTPKTAAIAPTRPEVMTAGAAAPSTSKGHSVPAAPSAAVLADADPVRTTHAVLLFASGATTLDAPMREQLARLLLQPAKLERITIRGRTDNRGSTKRNDAIALARTRHVHDYVLDRIRDLDVPVTIDAKGACCFISSNTTPEGRRANRRVEVVFQWRD